MPNYIGKIEAEWVDPAVELPPDGWRGLAINSDGDVVYATAHVLCVLLGHLAAWLRIGGPVDTVPRAKVQAAVDDIRDFLKIPSNNKIARAQDQGASLALSSVARHTGITPTEQVEDVVPPLSLRP